MGIDKEKWKKMLDEEAECESVMCGDFSEGINDMNNKDKEREKAVRRLMLCVDAFLSKTTRKGEITINAQSATYVCLESALYNLKQFD